MKINTYRVLYRGLEYLFKMAALLLSAVITGIIIITFFTENTSIIYTQSGYTVWLNQTGVIDPAHIAQAAMITAVFSVALFIHILWKAAHLFKVLRDGQSPFSTIFVSQLRYIAYTLFAANFAISAVYSLALSTLADRAYHLELSFGSSFLIGLVLIITTKVFAYGMALQAPLEEAVD
ncbi:hypothetical protein ADIAL_1133 [Alkalibacterium sp. AK22]|uniref:DUF2975 domain-containing protein n=1 Tax=Alkalibacterium sp. AK22 TaxID=1229520 RepID=UPI00044E9298|nr:DUF2975 domain-containing protein [Alkalibacterium sp. AK22]EXJ23429.1 hypothetical protein ADIAL_1133 [Alkalibacterium sp. AK22]